MRASGSEKPRGAQGLGKKKRGRDSCSHSTSGVSLSSAALATSVTAPGAGGSSYDTARRLLGRQGSLTAAQPEGGFVRGEIIVASEPSGPGSHSATGVRACPTCVFCPRRADFPRACRESSLLTTCELVLVRIHLSPKRFGGPASRRGSLNSLVQVDLHLPHTFLVANSCHGKYCWLQAAFRGAWFVMRLVKIFFPVTRWPAWWSATLSPKVQLPDEITLSAHRVSIHLNSP